MAKMKPGSPFLYDETTGDIVGVKDADGGDAYFTTAVLDSTGNISAVKTIAALGRVSTITVSGRQK